MIYGMSPLEVLAVYLMAILALALVIFLVALVVKKVLGYKSANTKRDAR